MFTTIVKISNDKRAIQFTFQSDTQKLADLTFTELEYQFNGLGYISPQLKDKYGNILATISKEEDVTPVPNPPVPPIPTTTIWTKIKNIFNRFISWFK